MRPTDGFLLDANLLVLLVVGLTSEALISRHKRTVERAFTVHHFRLLRNYLAGAPCTVLPNIVTEATNHLRQHKEPERTALMRTLAELLRGVHEVYLSSSDATVDTDFARLGLTDAAILQSAGRKCIVTVDAPLYVAASNRGLDVVNFVHLQAEAGLL